jgi:Mrp family chromosome partitioning ATPase
MALAQMCTGVVVCARFGDTTRDEVAEAIESLRHAHIRVLGTVLTGLPRRRPRSGVPEEDYTVVDPYRTKVPTSRSAMGADAPRA